MQEVVLFKGKDHCFSNWSPYGFEVDGISYVSSEQYMMAMKADVFGDTETKKKIMRTKSAKQAKILGRQVANYDNQIWSANREEVMRKGLLEKFLQNPECEEELLSTGDAIIGESVKYDKIWGTGIDIDNPNAKNPSLWSGQNLLGKVLMNVRDQIRYIRHSF